MAAASVVSLSVLLVALLLTGYPVLSLGSNFSQDVSITWGGERGKILEKGQLITLSLDQTSGSGFQSKNEYLFGKFQMKLKLVAGNSAGTVTAYYLSSQGETRDEIDFEFLGNLSGEPYILHTNIYTRGNGNREQQFHLWFDPTKHFHTYTILWNPLHVVFSVDDTPIRVFRDVQRAGVAFPNEQPMSVHGSIWNADDWATSGGAVKIDWTEAPFTASFMNFIADACVWSSGVSSCRDASADGSDHPWLVEELDSLRRRRLKWARSRYMIYDYCRDSNRFPHGLPLECSLKP